MYTRSRLPRFHTEKALGDIPEAPHRELEVHKEQCDNMFMSQKGDGFRVVTRIRQRKESPANTRRLMDLALMLGE